MTDMTIKQQLLQWDACGWNHVIHLRQKAADHITKLEAESETLQAEVARLQENNKLLSAEVKLLWANSRKQRAELERIEKINGLAHNYISCYDCRESSMIARAALAHEASDD